MDEEFVVAIGIGWEGIEGEWAGREGEGKKVVWGRTTFRESLCGALDHRFQLG